MPTGSGRWVRRGRRHHRRRLLIQQPAHACPFSSRRQIMHDIDRTQLEYSQEDAWLPVRAIRVRRIWRGGMVGRNARRERAHRSGRESSSPASCSRSLTRPSSTDSSATSSRRSGSVAGTGHPLADRAGGRWRPEGRRQESAAARRRRDRRLLRWSAGRQDRQRPCVGGRQRARARSGSARAGGPRVRRREAVRARRRRHREVGRWRAAECGSARGGPGRGGRGREEVRAGLARRRHGRGCCHGRGPFGRGKTGRWLRRGNKIVLYGV